MRKSIETLGALLVVMAAVASTPAFAQEVGVLSTVPQNFVTKGGASKVASVGGKQIESTASTSKGSFATKAGGSITVTFTGATTEAGKVKCKTGSEASGTIVIKGNFTVVALQESSKLLLAILISLPETLLISCGVLKVEVKGGLIGEATEYKEVATEAFKAVPMPTAGTSELILGPLLKLVFAQAAGVQKIKQCSLEKAVCEGKTFNLETNFGSGFEQVGVEMTNEFESEAGSKLHVDF